jgi:hypothetical protein
MDFYDKTSVDHYLHGTNTVHTQETSYRAFSSTYPAQDLSGTLQGAGGVGGLM